VSSRTWTFVSKKDGQKCIHARFINSKSGKKKDTYTCVILDKTPPSQPVILSKAVNKRRVTLKGTAEKNTLIYFQFALKPQRPRSLQNRGGNTLPQVDQEKIKELLSQTDTFRLANVYLAALTPYRTNTDSKGNWTYTFPSAFEKGNYEVTAQSEDTAGNTSPTTKDEVEVADQEDTPPPPPPTTTTTPATTTTPPPPLPPPSSTTTPPPIGDDNNPPPPNGDDPRQPFEGWMDVMGSRREGVSSTVQAVTRELVNSVASLQEALVPTWNATKEIAQQTADAVQGVIDHPKVEETTEDVVVPATVAVSVANVIVGGFQLPQLLTFLQYLFGQPLLLFRRRKMKKWGIVYNAFTKQPLDLAMVRLVNAETNRIVQSQVTDMNGRYLLIANPGKYRIEVSKPGYTGMSAYLKEKTEDGAYLGLYHGEPLDVSDKDTQIGVNIPLDPEGKDIRVTQIIRDHTWKTAQYLISAVGFLIALVSLVISPTPMIGMIVILHIIFYALFHRFAHERLPSTWGVVSIHASDKPLPNVVVRLFDAAYNKLVDTKVTDNKGRYALLVGPRTYFVTYEKPGFESKQSPPIDYSSHGDDGGIIARDEALQPVRGKDEEEKTPPSTTST
ncbi:MAG TPA: Ig-like domain-containing protein, partial [Candidatus Kapabacteria bacterium]|nr:Ig-like domain-containing protein [Candidatus Kapabacteria bacterium]